MTVGNCAAGAAIRRRRTPVRRGCVVFRRFWIMRVLVVDTCYDGFLADYERRHEDLCRFDYAAQHAHLMAQHFGTGNAVAAGLCAAGCQALTLVANANRLQRQWAREHGLSTAHDDPRRPDPAIIIEQVRHYRPDVVYVQELSCIRDDVWAEVRRWTRLLVGQIACSLPTHRHFASHDLMISSWMPLVDHFRTGGKPAEFLPLAFDASVRDHLGGVEKRYDVTFVGGLGSVHADRRAFLEELSRHVPLTVFGYGAETLPSTSPLLRCHGGPAWGMDMYRILASSRITLNIHGEIRVGGRAARWANNCRLFEATGVGTALLTDRRANLSDYFRVGQEVCTFTQPHDCAETIRRLLADPARLADVAASGQRRTLTDHTYEVRMAELADILRRYLQSTTTLKTVRT